MKIIEQKMKAIAEWDRFLAAFFDKLKAPSRVYCHYGRHWVPPVQFYPEGHICQRCLKKESLIKT